MHRLSWQAEWRDSIASLERVTRIRTKRCADLVARAFELSARCACELDDEALAREFVAGAEEARRASDPSTLILALQTRAQVEQMFGALGETERAYRELLAQIGVKGATVRTARAWRRARWR